MELILASASPRRADLLRNAAIEFRVEPAHVPEVLAPEETPETYARRLARDKARAILNRHPHSLILGADTIVIADGAILEKPSSTDDARRMLRQLSGRAHEVTTGVCLCNRHLELVEAETTRVFVAELTDQEISEYIATGEPMDKAGAYGIQGCFSRWVTKIEGDYFNVVGLPIARVCRMLGAAGFPYSRKGADVPRL